MRTATAIRAVGPRTASAAAVERGERRMLAALDDKARQPAGHALCGRAFRRVRDVLRPEASDRAVVRRWATAVVAGLFLLSGAAVTAASSDSVPGDTLYAVKLRSEDVRLLLASSPEARASLERQRAAERRAEVDALLRARREATVRFGASLTGLTDEAWIVGGLVVERAPQTRVDDALLLGDMVRRGPHPGRRHHRRAGSGGGGTPRERPLAWGAGRPHRQGALVDRRRLGRRPRRRAGHPG